MELKNIQHPAVNVLVKALQQTRDTHLPHGNHTLHLDDAKAPTTNVQTALLYPYLTAESAQEVRKQRIGPR
jgi:hypothetical protein